MRGGCGPFVLMFFCSRIVTVASSCFGCACVSVVIECFGICGCRSQPNGCMIVVMLYGHVRRYMRACHVAASRFLAAQVSCVILLFFAAESRE